MEYTKPKHLSDSKSNLDAKSELISNYPVGKIFS